MRRAFTLVEVLAALGLLSLLALIVASWLRLAARASAVPTAVMDELRIRSAVRGLLADELFAATAVAGLDEEGVLRLSTLATLPGESPALREISWRGDDTGLWRSSAGELPRLVCSRQPAPLFRSDEQGLWLVWSDVEGGRDLLVPATP